jgi:hypothetical protein
MKGSVVQPSHRQLIVPIPLVVPPLLNLHVCVVEIEMIQYSVSNGFVPFDIASLGGNKFGRNALRASASRAL